MAGSPDPLAAVAFLTRLPLGRLGAHDANAVANAAPLFPLVGAGLLLTAAGVAHAVGPPPLGAALAVSFLAAATGALHLDALADTADALAGRTREERLRIMRDHAIGAYGAAALALALLVETAAVTALLEHATGLLVFAAVGAASRATAPLLAAALPYARPAEQSPVRLFTARGGLAAVAAAAAICALAGTTGLAVLGTAAAVGAATGFYHRRRLGGITGDTLGATVQLSEAAALAVAAALA